MTPELQHLRETVEAARAELHPDLDPRLLSAVIDAEEAHPNDDSAALTMIERAFDELRSREES